MISTLTVENPKTAPPPYNLAHTNFHTSIHRAISSGDHAMLKTIAVSYVSYRQSEMNGHGHQYGHEFVSEADSDTRFFGSSDTDTDKLRTRVSAHLCRQ